MKSLTIRNLRNILMLESIRWSGRIW